MYISRRFHIFWSAVAVAILVMGMKYIFSALGWEALSVTSFHTGILAGTIFLIGFILSSTHADYKESEKIPVDIANAVMSLIKMPGSSTIKNQVFPWKGLPMYLKTCSYCSKRIFSTTGESL